MVAMAARQIVATFEEGGLDLIIWWWLFLAVSQQIANVSHILKLFVLLLSVL
jgi:hypothetical protein